MQKTEGSLGIEFEVKPRINVNYFYFLCSSIKINQRTVESTEHNEGSEYPAERPENQKEPYELNIICIMNYPI
jgi:hypothetical protein